MEIGFIAARTRSTLAGGHAALGATGAAGAAADDAVGAALDLVVRGRAPARGGAEPVADLDALDRLDAHQRAGQLRVEPAVPVHVRAEARRQPVDDHLDHAAERVAVLVGRVDLGDHRRRPVGVEGAHRVGVERLDVVGGRQRRVVGAPTAVPIATVCDTSRMP